MLFHYLVSRISSHAKGNAMKLNLTKGKFYWRNVADFFYPNEDMINSPSERTALCKNTNGWDMLLTPPSVKEDSPDSIDFDFYDKKARSLRSDAIISALKVIFKIIFR